VNLALPFEHFMGVILWTMFWHFCGKLCATLGCLPRDD